MAESLLRLLTKTLESNALKTTLRYVKELEDGLGRIDDYDHLFLLFSSNKKIEKMQLLYFLQKKEKELAKLNKKVIKRSFYLKTYERLSVTREFDFNTKAFVKKLSERIKREITRCLDFYLRYPLAFTELEGQIHEMRRKLRWITIYAQSLDGLVTLVSTKGEYAWQKKFVTVVELRSPYTKVPVKKNLVNYIRFNKEAFFAFSHVVNQLGKIKDRALEIEMLKKSLLKTRNMTDENAEKLALKQLSAKKNREELFKEAHTLLQEFFIKHRIHELLIIED